MFIRRPCLTRSFRSLFGGHSLYLKPRPCSSQLLTRPNHSYATVVPRAHTDYDAGYDAGLDGTFGAKNNARHDDKKAPVDSSSSADRTPRTIVRAAIKELEFMEDPYHIANRVREVLAQDNMELAACITKQASKKDQVVVSWNHLIDYQVKKGRLNAAIKLYNDMKKRAQLPNAQTFTILFRGCAASEHPKHAVGEALRLYHNMFNGRIQPNTIHMNAVLQVCAKMGDVESMFSVLKHATESDSDALQKPNNLTYTTVLNALRAKAEALPDPRFEDGLTTKQIEAEKATVIQHAKSIWDEVMARWTSGSIFIDEELVCAMGRILLLGDYHDAKSIEDLIYRTILQPTGLAEKVYTGKKTRAQKTQEKTQVKIDREKRKRELKAQQKLAEGNMQEEGSRELAVRTARPAVKAPGAPTVMYAQPGRNSLSLILGSLGRTRKSTKAPQYWQIFTVGCNVVPDGDNWNQYIRVVREGKNSALAASILQSMPDAMIRSKHVRHAMAACRRDNRNRSVLKNASSVLETMGRVPSVPDVRALRLFIQVAHASKHAYDLEARKDLPAAMAAWASDLAVALEALFGAYQTLAKQLDDAASHNTGKSKDLKKLKQDRAELIALERKMVATYDILTQQHGDCLTESQLQKIRFRHAGLTRRVTKYFDAIYSRAARDPQGKSRRRYSEEDPEEEDEEEEDREEEEEEDDDEGYRFGKKIRWTA